MNITTQLQFERVMKSQVLYPLIKEISRMAVDMIRDRLESANISTETLQAMTMYKVRITPNGYVSDIYIDENLVQATAELHAYDHFNKFMSLNMDTTYGGKSIAFWMTDWLENGVEGGGNHFGNQPIDDVGMFFHTREYLKNNLPTLVKNVLKKRGLTTTII